MANRSNTYPYSNVSGPIRLYSLAATNIGADAHLSKSLMTYGVNHLAKYGTILAAAATSNNLVHVLVEGGIDVLPAAVATADPDMDATAKIAAVSDTDIVDKNAQITIAIATDANGAAISFG
tara:strand:+ start:1671 stop:2036 length:366 start_codon:yes stop_codon:yes gene_type:complete